MARRIVEAGFPLTLWARRPESLRPFDGTAATAASTPAALAEVSSIVCICVTGDEDVMGSWTAPMVCCPDWLVAGH